MSVSLYRWTTMTNRYPWHYACRFADCMLLVYQHVDLPQDRWLLTCREAGLEHVTLVGRDIEVAKAEAVGQVAAAFRGRIAALKCVELQRRPRKGGLRS